MPFDIEGAKKAGYSDKEIADYLGKSSEFDLEGARKSGYKDNEIISHLSGYAQQGPPIPDPTVPTDKLGYAMQKTEPVGRPLLEAGGLVVGSVAGTPAGVPGQAAGGALGYAYGKKTADLIYGEPQDLKESFIQTGKDIRTGATLEMGGQILGVTVPFLFKQTGKFAQAIHGRLTGLGKEATADAIKAGKQAGLVPWKNYSDFDKALRGKITGDEVVANAQNALQGLKDMRSSVYRQQLEKIKLNTNQISEVRRGLAKTVKRLISKDKFNIKTVPDEKGVSFDFSESTLVKNQDVLNKALKDITDWKDYSAAGLDTLKKRMSTYVDQVKRGTPQQAFLVKIQNAVDSQLKQHVVGYGKMTKGYAEATKLIKDIEAGLMMRKQSMTGRIVADQTLRRLLSSTKDNFALRRDLVSILSRQGEDIPGQISGYAMRSTVPVGLAGTGPALIGNAALAQFVSPAFWPVLASSSPRLSAEFLRMFGKTLATMQGTGPTIGRMSGYAFTRDQTGKD